MLMKKKPVTVSDLGSRPKTTKPKAKKKKDPKVEAANAYTFVSEGFHGAGKKDEKRSFLKEIVAKVRDRAWDNALVRQAVELARVGRGELERRLKPLAALLQR